MAVDLPSGLTLGALETQPSRDLCARVCRKRILHRVKQGFYFWVKVLVVSKMFVDFVLCIFFCFPFFSPFQLMLSLVVSVCVNKCSDSVSCTPLNSLTISA